MKAVLEFDAPESCSECSLFFEIDDLNEYRCAALPGESFYATDFGVVRAPFCPLKIIKEEGQLVIMSCKIGDVVYNIIPSRGIVSTLKIISLHISDYSRLYKWELLDGIFDNLEGFEEKAIGRSVFLTREEAEAAMKRIRSGEE